jgi:hypothetical protein
MNTKKRMEGGMMRVVMEVRGVGRGEVVSVPDV